MAMLLKIAVTAALLTNHNTKKQARRAGDVQSRAAEGLEVVCNKYATYDTVLSRTVNGVNKSYCRLRYDDPLPFAEHSRDLTERQ